MIDRTEEYFTYLDKTLLSSCSNQRDPIKDSFSDLALLIAQQCVEFETQFEAYKQELNSINTILKPYTYLTLPLTRTEQVSRASVISSQLGTTIKNLHGYIKSLEQRNANRGLSETVVNHRNGIIAYLYNRVFQGSSEFQTVEAERLLREGYLKGCSSTYERKPQDIHHPFPYCYVEDDFQYTNVVHCISFLSQRWLKTVDEKFLRNLQLNQSSDTSDRILTPQRKTTQHKTPTASLNETTYKECPSRSQQEPSIEQSLVADMNQLLKTHKTQHKPEPLQRVLNTLSDLQGIMDLFLNEIASQSELCETIHTTAEESVEHITNASKELKKLNNTSRRSYRYYIILYYLTVSMLILLFDFFLSTRWI